MFKSIKEKVLNSITAHPKLLTFGIGLAITLAIGTISGSVDNSQAYAFMCPAKWCCC
ncbi:MAG TPA: hypothetical protein VN703_09270 [Candidatus Sulfopaludibacter sp.]|jgi:hypothetical protein|nr:hypothetical protein [Candidatus Sulfopaludibacter sp.]